MGTTKFELEKFDGSGDFELWRKKLRAISIQQKVAKALADMKDVQGTNVEKTDMQEIAYSTIILYLSDNVLR